MCLPCLECMECSPITFHQILLEHRNTTLVQRPRNTYTYSMQQYYEPAFFKLVKTTHLSNHNILYIVYISYINIYIYIYICIQMISIPTKGYIEWLFKRSAIFFYHSQRFAEFLTTIPSNSGIALRQKDAKIS